MKTFTNTNYHFAVDYPASWLLNTRSRDILPPAGTVFWDGNRLAVYITAFEQNPFGSEPGHLRHEGWLNEPVDVGGASGISFTRPFSESALGIWKVVNVERNGVWYDIRLSVHDDKLDIAEATGKFDKVIRSWKWTN